MVSIKLCQGLNTSWKEVTQWEKKKQLKKYNNATISVICSLQINVSEYSWDHFSNEFYLQSG